MTGPVPPGHGGLHDHLNRVDQRIDELSRRSPQPAICVVRLGSNVSAWNADNTNVVVGAEWNATPEVDTSGMWTHGTDSYLTIPHAGRWYLQVHSEWQPLAPSSPYVPNEVSSRLLLNGTSATANAVGSASAWYGTAGDDSTMDLIVQDRLFSTGDVLRFNFYSRYAGVTLLASIDGVHTHFVVRYLGPK